MLGRIASRLVKFLLLVLLCAALLYAATTLSDPPRIWKDPPLFPGAQNLNMVVTPVENRSCFFGCDYKVITYEANESTDAVFEFYYEKLWVDGGMYIAPPASAARSDTLRYSWLRKRQVYTAEVLLNPQGSSKTKVELKLIYMVGD
jgi:hypothetical protein